MVKNKYIIKFFRLKKCNIYNYFYLINFIKLISSYFIVKSKKDKIL